MAWWRKQADDSGFPKGDSGSGSLDDYAFDLIPRNNRVTMRLAGSDPYQADLATLIGESELTTAGGQRTLEDERIDAPTLIRLFTGTKVTGVVGTVPRGLEAVVSETLSRLEQAGKKPRIPVKIVQTRHGIRVELLMGQTR